MSILHIDSSINGENSVSRIITRAIVDQLKTLNPGAKIVRRDLAAEPLPHVTPFALAESAFVDEFLAADTVVIGAPMYNFGIPSQLKAWIDRIAIAGKTFRYTDKGPQGLVSGKKMFIASSRGGFYGADTPRATFDYQENYLRAVFAFLGISEITFIRAEGIALGAEARAKAMEAVRAEVGKLAA